MLTKVIYDIFLTKVHLEIKTTYIPHTAGTLLVDIVFLLSILEDLDIFSSDIIYVLCMCFCFSVYNVMQSYGNSFVEMSFWTALTWYTVMETKNMKNESAGIFIMEIFNLKSD